MLLNGYAVHLRNFATCNIGKLDIPNSAKRAGHEEEEERNLADVALSFSISITLCLRFLI